MKTLARNGSSHYKRNNTRGDNQRTDSNLRVARFSIVPVRNTVFFPGSEFPLLISRPCSVAAVRYAQDHQSGHLLLMSQIGESDDINVSDISKYGVISKFEGVEFLNDIPTPIDFIATERVRVTKIEQVDGIFFGEAEVLNSVRSSGVEDQINATCDLIVKYFIELVDDGVIVHPDALSCLVLPIDPMTLADKVAPFLRNSVAEKIKILATLDILDRLTNVLSSLVKEVQVRKVRESISAQIERDFNSTQRVEMLREQQRSIATEIDGLIPTSLQPNYSLQTEANLDLTDSVRLAINQEIVRYERLPAHSIEASLSRDRIELLLSLPWSTRCPVEINLRAARAIFDERHSYLHIAKNRILEYLAVAKQIGKSEATTIICLVGLPGVGKTTLAKSIAAVLQVPFVRIALGGVNDEAEIRGHRRTYTGAYPGHFAEALREAKVINPVILLDEIDKVGRDRGRDPSSALLEVLDPEQNHSFHDHFVDLPLDLSGVTFVATANNEDDIPSALRDRMEIIKISAYTEYEKLEIATRHLVPDSLRRCGLTGSDFSITDMALLKIIRDYTHEGGVRSLSRQIDSIVRKLVLRLVENNEAVGVVDVDNVVSSLGDSTRIRARTLDVSGIGTVTGMVATAGGGDLVHIESMMLSTSNQEHRLEVTGQIGSIMQESAKAAWSWVRAYLGEVGDQPLRMVNAHIHIPCGSVSKDGASAGLAMAFSLISAYQSVDICSNVAVTGEITLRGRVLAVDAIPNKIIAAHAAGCRTVIIPEDNMDDLDRVPANILDEMTVYGVSSAKEAVELILRCDLSD